MSRLKAATIACGLLAALGPGAAEGSIEIDSTNIRAVAGVEGSALDTDTYSDTSFPASVMLSAGDGQNSSVADLTLLDTGDQAIFSFEFTHVRAGSQNSKAELWNASVTFSVTEDTTYDLSGFYNVTDAGAGGGGVVEFSALLLLEDDSSFLVYSIHDSRDVRNVAFVLGDEEGDGSNTLIGDPNGDLPVGTYQLVVSTRIKQANEDPDSGASGVGNVTLTLGEAVVAPEVTAATPEPVSLVVWGGLGAVALLSRRPIRR